MTYTADVPRDLLWPETPDEVAPQHPLTSFEKRVILDWMQRQSDENMACIGTLYLEVLRAEMEYRRGR